MRFFVYDKKVYLLNQHTPALATPEWGYESYCTLNSTTKIKIEQWVFSIERKKGKIRDFFNINQVHEDGKIIVSSFCSSDVFLINPENGRVVVGYCSNFELEFLSNEFVKLTNQRVEFKLSSTLHLEESERRESFNKFSLIFVNNRVIRVEAEDDFNAHELMERLMCYFPPLVTS